ncbi:MAG: hypothetical protein IIC02_09305 [Planctomycetes bacterium]|nr:hypothetical protein [Planctomycetota bacterium]
MPRISVETAEDGTGDCRAAGGIFEDGQISMFMGTCATPNGVDPEHSCRVEHKPASHNLPRRRSSEIVFFADSLEEAAMLR